MRIMKKTSSIRIILLLLAVLVIFPGYAKAAESETSTESETTAQSETTADSGAVVSGINIYAYPMSKKTLVVYSDVQMKEKADKVPFSEYIILQISGDVVQVQYKADGKNKKGYISADTFFCDLYYKKTGAYVYRSGVFYLYKRRSTAKTQRYIPITYRSGGIKLGEKGNFVQLLMKQKGKYYLGWVTKSNYQKNIYASMARTNQILANGTYALSARVEKADTVEKQKYKLSYQGHGLYTLQNTTDKSYLEVGGEKKIRIVRKGAWFFLRSDDEKISLNYQGLSKKALTNKKQQWKLVKSYVKPSLKNSVVYSQYDPVFGSAVYKDGYDGVRTISSSGCGILSLVNAIYALNGQYISPESLAQFSESRGHYVYNQGTFDTLYADVAKKWGKTYQFKYAGRSDTFAGMRKHLQKKGTAIAVVPGHYIAIVAYRKSDQKYLVLDSAVSGSRPTSIYGDWKSMSELRSGKLFCYYFHLFSARK